LHFVRDAKAFAWIVSEQSSFYAVVEKYPQAVEVFFFCAGCETFVLPLLGFF
jgi:hypothetical protein